MLIFLISGCTRMPDEMEKAMELRSQLLQASGCAFSANITADYGEKIHRFSMDCKADVNGNISFTVSEPKTISGISGELSGEGGKLTFDDTALHFELLADNELSPICAPWVLVKTLRSGYLSSACIEDGKICLSVDDSYEENPLRLDIVLDKNHLPEYADILYDGRKILSVTVANFEIL